MRWWSGRWGWTHGGGVVMEIRKDLLKIRVEMDFYISI